MKKTLRTLLLIILLILGILGEAAFLYVNDSYSASDRALTLVEEGTEEVRIIEDFGKSIQFVPKQGATSALIFYPGGKVDYIAYAPLMEKLAQEGILCILVHMPGNLAVLDMDAAERYRDLYPEIKDWYLGGHSLGGSCAARYLDENPDAYKGLILLASYSDRDLNDTDLKVLSIYGNRDQVLKKEEYDRYKENLPSLKEYVITGGNHSQFADYGTQKGDGEASISRDKQMELTARYIASFIQQ